MEAHVCCPICHLSFAENEIQRHANGHFEDEDDILLQDFEPDDQPSSLRLSSHPQSIIEEQISYLILSQNKGFFHRVAGNGGLMPWLFKCLEEDAASAPTTTIFLSGHVDHFQSLPSEDAGWGCGWRNMQMLSSHLIFQRDDARDALFGGSGFVPDIPSLQRWLEIAWAKGFDPTGAQHFGNSIYGSKVWIGTTECAAMFRSFGIRARIVDFGPKEKEPLFHPANGLQLAAQVTRGNGVEICGPMDRYLSGRNSNSSYHLKTLVGGNQANRTEHSETMKNHQVLFDWVSDYFSSECPSTSSCHGRVNLTDKPPLYFQHEGHSRTIVGIEIKHQRNSTHPSNLLILDPSHRTLALEKSLRANVGWKSLIKRGIHALKKPQYQLCYFEPGIAGNEEMETLKTLDSVFIQF